MSNQPTTTTPAPMPDAQPVQAAFRFEHEDYHSARIAGSYAAAAEIAEALSVDPDLHPSIRAGYLAEAARMRVKSQPVQAATHTPGPWEAIIGGGGCSVIVNSTVQMPILVQIATDALYAHPERVDEAQANARLIAAAPALLAALEAIHEAGRMSSQPRAVYCALIAEDALIAAKGGAQ